MTADYFDLPLIRPQSVHRRLYQEVMFASAINQNTLVVLPTGLGKTVIAVVLSAYRLEKEPQSKVVMLAPTRPLVGQHHQRFSEMLLIVPEKLRIITGETPVLKRPEIWKSSSVVFMTPQTLRNDIDQGRYSLEDVTLLIFDEAHRASGRYEYVGLADYYIRQRKNHRILALTASPSNVRELCDALYIETIEARTEQSPDLIPYIQEVDTRYVIVDLPREYLRIEALLKQGFHSAAMPLIELGLVKPSELKFVGRRDLLKFQAQLSSRIKAGEGTVEPRLFDAMLGIALVLRLSHAREVLETQGIPQLLAYFQGIEQKAQEGKAPKNVHVLLSSLWYHEARNLLETLTIRGESHPKHHILLQILQAQIEKQANSRILVFTRFRISAKILTDYLDEHKKIRATRFVGQSNNPGDRGLSQREQLHLLEAFRANTYNVLVATNVGEEGLDISECNLVVFYDSVPSAVRRIQRRGRTGRQKPGKLIVLITRGTRDEHYHYRSLHKQRSMQTKLHHHSHYLRKMRK